MFPNPVSVPRKRCARCGHPVQAGRLVHGKYGPDCAATLGLTGTTTDIGQDGPDLLDLIGVHVDEPDDCCDGWDR